MYVYTTDTVPSHIDTVDTKENSCVMVNAGYFNLALVARQPLSGSFIQFTL